VRGAAYLSFVLGRLEEAITNVQHAIELDPLRGLARYNLGVYEHYLGRWDKAEEALRKTLDLNPQYPGAHKELALNYLAQSKLDQALSEIQKEPEAVWREYVGILIAFAQGKWSEGDAALSEFEKKYHHDSAFQIAELYAVRGNADKSFEWLDLAYQQRDVGATQVKGDPLLRSLESDARHRAFLQKMKLPLD
jgi:tetratricopeptide (TPR) repeat protein